jgi:hypothetical protein
VRTFRAFGQSDAGTQLGGWLDEAGFHDIRPGERLFAFHGAESGPVGNYIRFVVHKTQARA